MGVWFMVHGLSFCFLFSVDCQWLLVYGHDLALRAQGFGGPGLGVYGVGFGVLWLKVKGLGLQQLPLKTFSVVLGGQGFEFRVYRLRG